MDTIRVIREVHRVRIGHRFETIQVKHVLEYPDFKYRFGNESALRQHMQSAEHASFCDQFYNTSSLSCPDCKERFGTESKLRQHMWYEGHANFGLDPPFPSA